jgi:hypothetical protein
LLRQYKPVLQRMDPQARAKLTELIRKRPEAWNRAINGAKAKGWKPTSSARYSVATRKIKSGVRKASLSAQDNYASSNGEVLIWDWQDGNPSTLEGTFWISESYFAEELTFDLQFSTTSEEDLPVTYAEVFDYEPGDRYDPDGNPRTRGGLEPARFRGQGGVFCRMQRMQCLRAAIGHAAHEALQRTKWSTAGGTIACGLASTNVASFAACMGWVGGTIADNFANILSQETFCGGCGWS